MSAVVLDDISSAAYELFGPPRQRRDITICFGARSQLKSWDDRVACIEIEARCQSEPIRYAFQIAHEIVHALDPVPFGEASVLEEGVATYFQHSYVVSQVAETPETRDAWMHPEPRDYRRAYELVAPLFKHDRFVFRRLRETGATLSDLSLQSLLAFAPSLLQVDAEELLQKFEAWRGAI